MSTLSDGRGDVNASDDYECYGSDDEINEYMAGETIADGNHSKTMERLKSSFDFIIRIPYIGFYGYETSENRDQAVSEFVDSGYEVHEIVFGDRPHLVNIDVDYKINEQHRLEDANIQLVIDAFIAEAKYLGVENPKYDVVYSSRPSKESWHIISDGWMICDGMANKEFCRRVKDRLALHPIGSDGSIDCRGTLRTYSLRVPFCQKSNYGEKVKGSELMPIDGIIRYQREQINKWFLQSEDYATYPIYGVPTSKENTIAKLSGAELSAVISKVIRDYPDANIIINAAGYYLAAFSRPDDSLCAVCEKTHKKHTMVLVQMSNGAVFLKCATYSGKLYLKCYIDGVKLSKELTEIKTLPSDRYNDLLSPEASIISARYNSDVIIDNGKSDYYIRSAWGTGKSVHNSAVVKSILKTKVNAKILVLSSRKSLTAQLVATIPNACSYEYIKGMLDINKNPISVWQYESIKRIPVDSFGLVDLLLIDEPNQLFAHAENNSFGITAAVNMMISKARRIIVTDNDLSDFTVSTISSIRSNTKIIINNKYNKYEGVSVDIFQGVRKNDTLKTIAVDRVIEQKKKKDAGDDTWEGTVFPIHCKKDAAALYKKLSPILGNDVVLYTGDTDGLIKKMDFSDATAVWSHKVAIIYTSTVSVGVSCDSPRITECFAFFNNNNITATQSSQMLFRCRQLKRIHIGYAQPRFSPSKVPTDLPGICKYMTEANNRKLIPDMFRDDRNPFIRSCTTTDPEALENVLRSFEGGVFVSTIIDKYRSHYDFLGNLTSTLRRSGLNVIVNMSEPIKTIEDLKEFRAEMKGLAEAANFEQCQLIATNALPITKMIIMESSNGGNVEKPPDASAEVNAGFDGHFLKRKYGLPELMDISAEWVEKYKPLVGKYVNLRECISRRFEGSIPNRLVTTTNEKHNLINSVFTAIGVDPTCVEDVKVSVDKIKECTLIAETVCTNGYRVLGKSIRNNLSKEKPKTIVTVLNYALDEYGGKLKPLYKTKTDETRGKVSGYLFCWEWGSPLITPVIEHPVIVNKKHLEKLGPL